MPHKQTIQIPIDNCRSITLELSVIRLHDSLCSCESVIGNVCEERIPGIRVKPHPWLKKVSSLWVSVVKAIGWFNHLGSGKIDEKLMETNYNRYLRLRIRGMDR